MRIVLFILFVFLYVFADAQNTDNQSPYALNNQALNQYEEHPAVALLQLEKCSRKYANKTCRSNLKKLREDIGIGKHRAFAFGLIYGFGAQFNFLSSLAWRLLSVLFLAGAALFFYLKKRNVLMWVFVVCSLLFFCASSLVQKWERADDVYIVKEDQTQLYASPYLTSEKEKMAYAGQLVLVLQEYEEWCLVQVEHVSQGWIEKKYISKI